MVEAVRPKLPRVLDNSAKPDGEYTTTIVSAGRVYSRPDPLIGERFFFGIPPEDKALKPSESQQQEPSDSDKGKETPE